MSQKFRIYSPRLKRYLSHEESLHCGSEFLLDQSGKVVELICCDGKYSIDKEQEDIIRFNPVQILPKYIVEFSTGIFDKAGNEIYEGDILEARYTLMFSGNIRNLSVVKRNKSQAGFREAIGGFVGIPRMANPEDSGNQDPWVGYDAMKVIGNMMENPDLIQNG